MLTLMRQVVSLVQKAGQASLAYWGNKPNAISLKADKSPVTEADIAVNKLLIQGLTNLAPAIAILSEESSNISLTTRLKWQRWWLIDPLDGTKEFIDNRSEYLLSMWHLLNKAK